MRAAMVQRFAAPSEGDRVVRTRIDDAVDAFVARCLPDIDRADDVGLQDLRPGALARVAAAMDDGIHIAAGVPDGLSILEVACDAFLMRLNVFQWNDVRQDKALISTLERGPQHPADAAARASDEHAIDGTRHSSPSRSAVLCNGQAAPGLDARSRYV
ncbi:hypothetical protein CHELA20_53480 [Hyphomicrobiales bacterium]|nr:hypothetical protein CHELA41_21448 [Hyphomicrobiales bacterium]CAH1684334.1 hypothetical protein CHELA20_53480 [Hyphomicrobiales bacterium]